jgi:hypothetical protein
MAARATPLAEMLILLSTVLIAFDAMLVSSSTVLIVFSAMLTWPNAVLIALSTMPIVSSGPSEVTSTKFDAGEDEGHYTGSVRDGCDGGPIGRDRSPRRHHAQCSWRLARRSLPAVNRDGTSRRRQESSDGKAHR